MKRNSSCDSFGHGGHGSCPPQSSCNQVKAKSVSSDLRPVPPWKGAVKLDHPFIDAQVSLADFELEIDVEADVHLPKPAKEIKSVRKNVTLKQCKAVPSSQSPKVVKLFITGVLHKNIQFVEECSGVVRDFSTDITFTTIKRVKLDNPLVNPFGHDDIEFSQKASVSEYRESAKDGHGANPCISGSETFETFNEPIECKLLGTKIREIDLLKHFDNWGRFSTITEKAEIRLFLRLSQMQKIVFDPTPDHKHHDHDHGCDHDHDHHHHG